MSVFNNWYISKARKFEVQVKDSGKGTLALELNVYDTLKLDATPDQWRVIVDHLNAALKSAPNARSGQPTQPRIPAHREEDY
jgi:hypothetical protein